MALPSQAWLRAREQVPVKIFHDSDDVSRAVAAEMAQLIQEKEKAGQPCVLGLATGSTPMHVYGELVRLHKEQGLSFKHVVSFNLDEYFPMQPSALQSYRRFMQEHLFDHVDIQPENVHIPDGTIPLHQVARHCEEYEAAIDALGGIDLQLLGLGRTGHIGFNEKGSSRSSVTRLITLDKVTRVDAASDFFGEEHVPRRAITMGVSTILKAKRVVLMAFGENKTSIVTQTVEGPVTAQVAASFLQEHPAAQLFLDYAAASGLTRVRTPWVLGPITWDTAMVRKAAIWLAQLMEKPLLKLTDNDYNENSLQDLLAEQGPAYNINLRVFYDLQRTITGWPGGKPASGEASPAPKLAASGIPQAQHDASSNGVTPPAASSPNQAGTWRIPAHSSTANPSASPSPIARSTSLEHQLTGHVGGAGYSVYGPLADSANRSVFPKRVLIMSPHPDDDVISMGGTFARLVDQGHDVHVAYQTSGNIAVWDEDAIRFADFAAQFGAAMGLDSSRSSGIAAKIETFLKNKQPGQVDSEEVQKIKTLIRYCEARAAGRTCGAKVDNLHFLDMPFYETGAVVKKPLCEEDIQILVDLFDRLKPHQIFAAGDLSDPHGTHRTCLQAIFKALEVVRHRSWWAGCEVWLYRGAWQEWEPWEIEMAVPLSPAELQRKISAIFKHQSQKDKALFPGADPREFWQRAQARNQATAATYDKLGLPEYEAMEAFAAALSGFRQTDIQVSKRLGDRTRCREKQLYFHSRHAVEALGS
ncbi:hypothetical protein WJX72_002667 [[Myrmecia] bisecta]|uniref:Glucosamine/galactosamine-6-phosphate isomerase domain-containing protein n=1 Tax=[Myrmecia] bisecta TaxID=41462 RepID=A0AAW1QPQ6_9CHLO